MEIYVWLAVFAVLIALELATMQLVTVWFAVGALAAFIAAFFTESVEIQLTLFLIVSLLLLLLVRPVSRKLLMKQHTKTNVDSLVGQTAIVTARIHNQDGFGKATLHGQEWTAAAEDDNVCIEAGTKVTVMGISGVKLIVKPAAGQKITIETED